MNKKLLPWLITFCALGLGGTAAYYSIIGLSKLFAGVATAVIIMASFLEMSKLTLATLLHSYWDQLNRLSKIYYITSLVILSFLTSAGIYGMLSSGYQETANKAKTIDLQISLIETKRNNIKEQLAVFNVEKESINADVGGLRFGLSNNIIQYKDKETGQIITTTSSSNRKSLEKQLDQAIERQTKINTKVDDLNIQLFEYETKIVEVSTNSNIAKELGPLKYISGLTGVGMDKIVNILLLTIIFVFDPLAIALVIAANFAFEQLKGKYKENIYSEQDINTIIEANENPPTSNDSLKNAAEQYKQFKETQHQHIVDMMKADEKDGLYNDLDSTLIDGLEDEQWDNDDKAFIKNLTKNELSDNEKKWDLNNDGILSKEELKRREDAMLNDSSISQWRKNKILRQREEENPNQITY